MIGYKIVYRNNKQLWSFNCTNSSFKCGVIRYILNRWVYPKSGCGPLAVFLTFKDVENFLGCTSTKHSVYLCDYEYSDDQRLFVRYSCGGTIVLTSAGFPKGARAATRVKLLKRIGY